MLAKFSIAFIFALVSHSALAEQSHFEFAGFTITTTLSEAKKRYPRSYEANSYIYVSEDDSHNHIYGISISSTRTLLHFEKRLENGGVSYPLCRTQFDQIFTSYGGPHVVQKFNEEASSVHRRVWKKGIERLVLTCFETDGSRLAERVELYVAEPNAT
jgi:hypothetical protein